MSTSGARNARESGSWPVRGSARSSARGAHHPQCTCAPPTERGERALQATQHVRAEVLAQLQQGLRGEAGHLAVLALGAALVAVLALLALAVALLAGLVAAALSRDEEEDSDDHCW